MKLAATFQVLEHLDFETIGYGRHRFSNEAKNLVQAYFHSLKNSLQMW